LAHEPKRCLINRFTQAGFYKPVI